MRLFVALSLLLLRAGVVYACSPPVPEQGFPAPLPQDQSIYPEDVSRDGVFRSLPGDWLLVKVEDSEEIEVPGHVWQVNNSTAWRSNKPLDADSRYIFRSGKEEWYFATSNALGQPFGQPSLNTMSVRTERVEDRQCLARGESSLCSPCIDWRVTGYHYKTSVSVAVKLDQANTYLRAASASVWVGDRSAVTEVVTPRAIQVPYTDDSSLTDTVTLSAEMNGKDAPTEVCAVVHLFDPRDGSETVTAPRCEEPVLTSEGCNAGGKGAWFALLALLLLRRRRK